MNKLARIFQKLFAGSATANPNMTIFGSLAQTQTLQYSNDPTQLQSLTAFEQGWAQAVVGNDNPTLEDMNALFFLAYYQLNYLFQQGIPEFDIQTTYFKGSFVTQIDGTGMPTVYYSLADNNVGNTPSTNIGGFWGLYLPGNANFITPGTVLASPQNTLTGSLLCNGGAVSRLVYNNLFSAIGTNFGAGDGSSTFNLPDYRGYFLQGADGGTFSPANTFTPMQDQLQNITGRIGSLYNGGGPPQSGAFFADSPAPSYQSGTSSNRSYTYGLNIDASLVARTGTFTAPRNYAVNWFIKY